jgi:hypothetical protein
MVDPEAVKVKVLVAQQPETPAAIRQSKGMQGAHLFPVYRIAAAGEAQGVSVRMPY